MDVLPLRIRRARQEAGLTLAELADGKVSRTAIHLIETGRSRPSPETLAHIASRTGKPVGYFVGASGDEPEPSPADVARQAGELMLQVSWKLARLLRQDHLSGAERIALESVLTGTRQGMRLIRALHGVDAPDRARSQAAPAGRSTPPRLVEATDERARS